jgi:hypothetical protein
VPSYLVEIYVARCAATERQACERRVRRAVEEQMRQGTSVRFRHVIHVPEDELCLFVLDAPSAVEAERVARLAGVGPLRVVEAISSREEPT